VKTKTLKTTVQCFFEKADVLFDAAIENKTLEDNGKKRWTVYR
jgi:hypothetical protein